MTPAEQQHKLSMIRTLSDKELRGWWLYVVTRELRPEFDGERGIAGPGAVAWHYIG